MLKRHWYKANWSLLFPVILLIAIGIIMIFSTSSIVGFSNYNDSYFFIKRHIAYLFMGFIACFVGITVPHTWYRSLIPTLFCIMILFLCLTLTPLGVKIGGAQRWLSLGFIQFQPVEIAKFVIILVVARGLDRSDSIFKYFFKGCLPILIILCIPLALLALQPDMGNIGIILSVVFCLFFLSKMPLRHIASLICVSISGIVGVILQNPYQLRRITAFLDPWADPLGKNYHMVQSLIAIGSGGLTGMGLGESKLKYFYLPLQYSDFIFSIICEEGGFLLALFVITLYLSIVLKTYHIVKKCAEPFSFYLGMGCALLVCMQAFINIAVVIGLFPVTGIPLTFISFGGTSLITSLFYIGIIINISNTIILKDYDIERS